MSILRPLLRPMMRPLLRSASDGGGGSSNPNAIAPDAFYDITSDFSFLTQDRAGAIPVTALEQVVGQIRDRSVNGRHAIATSDAARGTVSARYNRLLNTASTLAPGATNWSGSNITGTIQGDGSSLVERTSTAASAFSQQTGLSFGIGTRFAARMKVKKATIGNLYALRVQGTYPDRADAVVNLDTGGLAFSGSVSFTGLTASVSSADEDGFYTISLSATVANTAVIVFVHGPANSANGFWETNSATLLNAYVKEPDIWFGVSVPRHQRVTTATDYDSVGFPVYVRGNGTNTGYTVSGLAGIAFPFTIICSAQADVNILGGAFGLWGGDPPYYEIQKTTNADQWRAFDRGATNYTNTETVGNNGMPHVLTMEMTADTVNLRMDGTDPTAATTQDNLVGSLTELRIFNGGGGFFNGGFLGGVWKSNCSDTQRNLVEQYFARKDDGLTA